MHDNVETIWSVSRNHEQLNVHKVNDSKDNESELKAELVSWKKVVDH